MEPNSFLHFLYLSLIVASTRNPNDGDDFRTGSPGDKPPLDPTTHMSKRFEELLSEVINNCNN